MKVTLSYEDSLDLTVHKTLRITLPKSWKTGPTSKLLSQFVESYNESKPFGEKNPLNVEEMHLAIRKKDNTTTSTTPIAPLTTAVTSPYIPIASDAITVDALTDCRDDVVYVMHGRSETIAEMEQKRNEEKLKALEQVKNTVQCTRFGCTVRFQRGTGTYPGPCIHHKSPPVFHETAKFWSCCPHKKAYDFEEFQKIPGCETLPYCTDVKENTNLQQKSFLGGMDLREQVSNGAVPLKSIDDFNKAQEAGGAAAAPILERLQNVLLELGIEKELFQQVIDGLRKEFVTTTGPGADNTTTSITEVEALEFIRTKLGGLLKDKFKSIAAEQLRIK